MAGLIKGFNVVGTQTALNAEAALVEIIGNASLAASNYNESSMADRKSVV